MIRLITFQVQNKPVIKQHLTSISNSKDKTGLVTIWHYTPNAYDKGIITGESEDGRYGGMEIDDIGKNCCKKPTGKFSTQL